MNPTTIIPPEMRIHGRVEAAGDLLLEGSFVGAIEVAGAFTLAAGAACQASVLAETAHIRGQLTGSVVCARAIFVAAGARVIGDLRAPGVEIHPDAEVLGEIVRSVAAPVPAGHVAVAPQAVAPAAPVAPAPAAPARPEARTSLQVRGPVPQRPMPPGQSTARLFVPVRRPDDRPVPKPPRLRGKIALVRRSSGRTGGAGAAQ